jgi:hypothetical protein
MTATSPLMRTRFARVSLVIFALLTPFVGHALWDYIEARRLRARIDDIAARGEPLTAFETSVVRLTGGAEDSERYYRAAAALVEGDDVSIDGPTAFRIGTAERDGVWTDDLLAAIRASVDRYRGDALPLVDRAASLPFERFRPGTWSVLQTGAMFRLAHLCDWRAVLRAASADGDGAADSLFSEARLGRALLWPPSLNAVAFVLQHAPPSATARARLAGALAPLDRDDRLKWQFMRTRATIIDEQRTDRAIWSTPARTLRIHRVVQVLDEYTALIQATDTPWPTRQHAVPAVGLESPRVRRTSNDRTVLDGIVQRSANDTKSIRCARLAVSRGSLKLVDPFTGKPLDMAACRPLVTGRKVTAPF